MQASFSPSEQGAGSIHGGRTGLRWGGQDCVWFASHRRPNCFSTDRWNWPASNPKNRPTRVKNMGGPEPGPEAPSEGPPHVC